MPVKELENQRMEGPVVSFEDFLKLDIRIGTVSTAEKVSGADKLVRLEIDLGSETRQVVAGIAPHYSPEQIVGKQVPILVNLQPRTLRGIESQGMILAADVEGEPVLLVPDHHVKPGSPVR